jgi:hypothetical protein
VTGRHEPVNTKSSKDVLKFVLYATVCASCIVVTNAAASDITPVGTNTYKLSVPTCEIHRCAGAPGRKIRDYDDIREQARQYCAKMKKKMVITTESFDMGPGLTFVFSCVPPSASEPTR